MYMYNYVIIQYYISCTCTVLAYMYASTCTFIAVQVLHNYTCIGSICTCTCKYIVCTLCLSMSFGITGIAAKRASNHTLLIPVHVTKHSKSLLYTYMYMYMYIHVHVYIYHM